METVFDYNITDKEREDIGISDKERYLAIVGEDTANLDLATLFHTRGDNDRMARYADKLPLEMMSLKWACASACVTFICFNRF